MENYRKTPIFSSSAKFIFLKYIYIYKNRIYILFILMKQYEEKLKKLKLFPMSFSRQIRILVPFINNKKILFQTDI